MNSRNATIAIVIVLLVFAGYIIYDLSFAKEYPEKEPPTLEKASEEDIWITGKVFDPGKDQLHAVTVNEAGMIIIGGDSYVASFDTSFSLKWEYKPGLPVTALAAMGEKIYAGAGNQVIILDNEGKVTDEWGPFESNGYITSISVNESVVAFGDAANKKVYLLDKNGSLQKIIGGPEDPFIIPSRYFDVALDTDNNIYIAHTGKWRIEKRSSEGRLISWFGQSGTEKESFCGCCNPGHFILYNDEFITAEKGINRIKILDKNGGFKEFVSSGNMFTPSVPLDLASSCNGTIYGVNPSDSKVYVFTRK